MTPPSRLDRIEFEPLCVCALDMESDSHGVRGRFPRLSKDAARESTPRDNLEKRTKIKHERHRHTEFAMLPCGFRLKSQIARFGQQYS